MAFTRLVAVAGNRIATGTRPVAVRCTVSERICLQACGPCAPAGCAFLHRQVRSLQLQPLQPVPPPTGPVRCLSIVPVSHVEVGRHQVGVIWHYRVELAWPVGTEVLTVPCVSNPAGRWCAIRECSSANRWEARIDAVCIRCTVCDAPTDDAW